MGCAITSGRDIILRRNTLRATIYIAFDLEPDASQVAGGGFQRVTIADNTIDGYSVGQNFGGLSHDAGKRNNTKAGGEENNVSRPVQIGTNNRQRNKN